MLRILCAAALAMTATAATARSATLPTDSVAPTEAAASDTVPKPHKSIVNRVLDYFKESNKPPEPGKPFDVSFIGGPYYSSEVKLALGIIAAGSYHPVRYDSLTPRSVVALKTKVSISGYVELGVDGTHIFPHDHWRLIYDANFQYLPTYYWGIGYESCSDDAGKSKYTYIDLSIQARMMRRLSSALFIGPTLDFHLMQAKKQRDPALWEGGPRKSIAWGPGVAVSLDTRDNLTAPTRGVWVTLTQTFCPRFLGNGDYSFSATELTASVYAKLWKGGVLASQVHSRWAYGNPSWGSMSTFGGSSSMRGYYEGQYRDKFEADLTVELRQHVWRRNGLVVWGDLAAIAPKPGGVRLRELLPGCGLGYRWEFKKYTNVRVDVGVGRHTKGIMFSVNEAF